MNKKLLALMMSSVLTACGGGGGGSGGSDYAVNAYSSPSCMTPPRLDMSHIDLTGVTLKGACVHKTSTQDDIVLESTPGANIEFLVDHETNKLGLANLVIAVDENNPNYRNNNIHNSDLPEFEIAKIIQALDAKNAHGLIPFIDDSDFGWAYVVSSIPGGITTDSKTLDFSIRVRFNKPGEYDGLTRSVYLYDAYHDPRYDAEARADIFNQVKPRKERYRFIIKDPNKPQSAL